MSQCTQYSDSPPSTYPIDTDPTNFDSCLFDNTDQTNKSVWGRLIPIATNLNTKVFDLENDSYLFGRQNSCDFIFSKQNMCDEHIMVISKVHFKISRNQMTSVYVVYLEDLSFNGTYVNGDKIGKGRKTPLKNNDVISLALPHVKVFVYTDLKEEQACYPLEIKRKYTVTGVLGTGACGQVHLVFEKDTSKMFAMKIIQKSKYSSGGINDPKKIKNEVKILKTLLHPCVVQIEDFLDATDQFFIILSLAEGGDLMKYIVEKRFLSENETKKIFYQVVLAVQYLHSKGIAHRDLKPQNILLTGRGEDSLVKITDFGLSKTLYTSLSGNGFSYSQSWSGCGKAKNGLMKTVCGSPLYVAPEILSANLCSSSGNSDVGYTHKVDIWSMGVILYICLSGHPPFLPASEYECHGDESNSDIPIHNSQKTLQSAILKGEYSFPRKLWQSVSEMAKDLVKKMLTVDPNKRITIEEILNHDWLQDDSMKCLVHSLMDKQSPGCLQETSSIVGPVDFDLSSSFKRRKTCDES